jgi:hypothetical protein
MQCRNIILTIVALIATLLPLHAQEEGVWRHYDIDAVSVHGARTIKFSLKVYTVFTATANRLIRLISPTDNN